MQTFRVYLGRAYPQVPASLTQVLSWKAQQSWQGSQFLLLQEVPLPAGATEAVPMFFSATDRALARWCPAVCRNSVPRVPSGASY
ncbi:hypothetical protein KSC_000360 [Ktedonobacter sp. SOSP1-52]|uniref:hypothetical protein n=1 Tax=Ktedonobacter sp. SOSP1-52 TaxID=2778366 RepID=UPI0019160FC6|nr:hypothetical protein [Ktedonobacter sp. SOSP1-52]GHO61144.1 hypothetical protein KSC_000360 [Ktedonobacter sp. SOSP1-52]